MLATKTVQVSNEEQLIIWDGYGLKLHIPSNALPDNFSQLELKMEVALPEGCQLPDEDGVLVSAVYSFSHDLGGRRLRHAVTLEMQHCVATSALKDLSIIRANAFSENFEMVPGGDFKSIEHYGLVKLFRFSRFAVFLRRFRSLFSLSSSPLEYCSRLFYTSITHLQFDFEFCVIRNLDCLSQVCCMVILLLATVCMYMYMYNTSTLVNPQRTCAAWVTVLGLCVCLGVLHVLSADEMSGVCQWYQCIGCLNTLAAGSTHTPLCLYPLE